MSRHPLDIKTRILRVLVRWPNRALQSHQIVELMPASDQPPVPSATAVLAIMVRHGLVERDGGEKGWFAITAKGVSLA